MINNVIHTIKHHLQATGGAVDQWFDKPAALRHYRPATGGWTIDEILEHITLTSHFLLKLIDKGGEKALKNAASVDLEMLLQNYTFNSDALEEIGRHQSFVWNRPEHMEPGGTASAETIRQTLAAQTDRCLEWLEKLKNGEGILAKTTMTVNNLGKIDVYQYIYFLSQHARRHISQMEKNEAEYTRVHATNNSL